MIHADKKSACRVGSCPNSIKSISYRADTRKSAPTKPRVFKGCRGEHKCSPSLSSFKFLLKNENIENEAGIELQSREKYYLINYVINKNSEIQKS